MGASAAAAKRAPERAKQVSASGGSVGGLVGQASELGERQSARGCGCSVLRLGRRLAHSGRFCVLSAASVGGF